MHKLFSLENHEFKVRYKGRQTQVTE